MQEVPALIEIMNSNPLLPLFITVLLLLLVSASALAGPRPSNSIIANMPSPTSDTVTATSRSRCTSLKLSGGSSTNEAEVELTDYSGQMSSLFGNIRVPAALFAGASAGAAFAMPLGDADGLRIGLVKRIYSLLMMSALSNQLLAIIVSTVSMGGIAVATQSKKATSMQSFIEQYFELPWVTVRFNFLAGIMCFVVGSGLRAWVQISCPIFARVALGIITSSTILALAFIENANEGVGCTADLKGKKDGPQLGIFNLSIKYVTLLFRKAQTDPIFALGVVSLISTWGYAIWKLPHVWTYLEKH